MHLLPCIQHINVADALEDGTDLTVIADNLPHLKSFVLNEYNLHFTETYAVALQKFFNKAKGLEYLRWCCGDNILPNHIRLPSTLKFLDCLEAEDYQLSSDQKCVGLETL